MATATSTLTTTSGNKLMPAFVGETFNGLNELSLGLTAGCRTFRKSMEGLEKTVDGLDEITTLALRQQRNRLLAELQET